MRTFKRVEFTVQSIVVGIAYFRSGFNIIKPIMPMEFIAQKIDALLFGWSYH
jgi:hypothetical protein